MKFAVIIVTYTSPKQTKRLIDCLDNGDFDFYIHLDKKVDMETHRELFNTPNVIFVNDRVDIKWGGNTTVEATYNSIRQIASSGKKYAFISLISGQDYPIKSAAYISDFLSKNTGKEFMLFKYFDKDWTEAKARVEKYHLNDYTFKGKTRIEQLMNLITPKRKFPIDNMELCGKESFWTLSQECATYVVDYIDSNPKLKRFLKFTWGSDEFVFQSILMNSHFKSRVVNNNLRFINWPPVGSRPNIFVTADFERIMASDALFGRKFDLNTDENIFDLLDKKNKL